MVEELIIADAVASDESEITAMASEAFGQTAEARLIRDLTAAGDAAISLVARSGGRIVGHVLLSPMTAPFRALALAPLAVKPAVQRRGIGSTLVSAAIDRARGDGWHGIFVLGDPAYYGRLGFDAAAAAGFSTPYAGSHFMILPLAPPLPRMSGALHHAPAFAALG